MANCPGNEYKAAKLNRKLEKPEFSYFVRPWLERARHGGEPFESLIHLWVAFNAWMAEVVDPPELMERDLALINAAARDAELNVRFKELSQHHDDFKAVAEEFRSLWPVFNVRRLDQVGIGPWGLGSRDKYRKACFDAGATENDYKPGCFLDHQVKRMRGAGGDPSSVPLDWPHTVFAIYQVRCNLFHGGKTFRMESDVHFARMSFKILWDLWGGSYAS